MFFAGMIDSRKRPLCSHARVLALLLAYSGLVQAADGSEDAAGEGGPLTPWSGSSGELGFAATRGNSSTESVNGRLKLHYAREAWIHRLDLFALRSSARYTNTDEAGNTTQVRQSTANRYSIATGSAWQMGEHRQLNMSARYEHDSFANFDSLYIAGVSYGTRLVNGEHFIFDAQLGPGARRAHEVVTDRHHTEFIVRGTFDLKWQLTGNTELVNNLLLESGSSNTFAQNDMGILVAMNERLALKAGWQARYNSDVDEGRRKSDILATMNVVYRFK